MSSKVIIICVNLLIISCLAAATKEINEPNDSARQLALHAKHLHLNTENLLKQLQYYSSIIKVYMANPKQIGNYNFRLKNKIQSKPPSVRLLSMQITQ